jgi:hypothetical protein
MRLFPLYPKEELTKAKANGSKASNEKATLAANTKAKQKLNYLSCIKQHIQDIMEENQRLIVGSSPVSSPVSATVKPRSTNGTPTSSGKLRKF